MTLLDEPGARGWVKRDAMPQGFPHVGDRSTAARFSVPRRGRSSRRHQPARTKCGVPPWANKARACCETATLRRNRVVPKILEPRSHFSANLVEWSTVAVCESTAQKRSVQMIRVVIDTVLFSCMGAIVTGIVIAAATLLG